MKCILQHAAKSRCSLFSHRLHSTKTTQYDSAFLYNVKSLCVQNYSKPWFWGKANFLLLMDLVLSLKSCKLVIVVTCLLLLLNVCCWLSIRQVKFVKKMMLWQFQELPQGLRDLASPLVVEVSRPVEWKWERWSTLPLFFVSMDDGFHTLCLLTVYKLVYRFVMRACVIC